MRRGRCKLCREEALLVRSHKVPRWAMKLASDNGKYRLLGGGNSRLSTRHWTEEMLCEKCERRIKAWEDAAKRVIVNSVPKREPKRRQPETWRTAESNGTWGLEGRRIGEAGYVTLERCNTKTLMLFALSVAWRASVGEKCPRWRDVPRFKLDQETEERMRDVLLGKWQERMFRIFPTEVALISDSRIMPYRAEDPRYHGNMVWWPTLNKTAAGEEVVLLVCRMQFRIRFGAKGPGRHADLRKDGKKKGQPVRMMDFDSRVLPLVKRSKAGRGKGLGRNERAETG